MRTMADMTPMEIFNNDQDVRKVLMQLINGTFAPGDPELFRPLYNSPAEHPVHGQGRHLLHPQGLQVLCRSTEESGSCLPRRGQLGEERHPECGMLRQVHI